MSESCPSAVMESEGVAQVVVDLAELLRTTTTVGFPAPVVERIGDRLRSPGLGDLVVVCFAGRSSRAIDRVGRYVSTWTYLAPEDEPDQPLKDRSGEVVFEIETLDGRLYKWTDVELMWIPATVAERLEVSYGPPCENCGGLVGHDRNCIALSTNRAAV